MNKFIFLIMIICYLAYTGCATIEDLEKTQRRFGTEIGALQEENAAIRNDMGKDDQAIADVRKRIADVAADMTGIREDMESLRGDREVQGKGESDLKAEFLRKNKEFDDIKNQYGQLSSRIKAMENLLEIGSGASQSPKSKKIVSDDSKSAASGKTEK